MIAYNERLKYRLWSHSAQAFELFWQRVFLPAGMSFMNALPTSLSLAYTSLPNGDRMTFARSLLSREYSWRKNQSILTFS
ncbi:MAG: hypothetical protein WBB28_06640 [Crinalium sp.]